MRAFAARERGGGDGDGGARHEHSSPAHHHSRAAAGGVDAARLSWAPSSPAAAAGGGGGGVGAAAGTPAALVADRRRSLLERAVPAGGRRVFGSLHTAATTPPPLYLAARPFLVHTLYHVRAAASSARPGSACNAEPAAFALRSRARRTLQAATIMLLRRSAVHRALQIVDDAFASGVAPFVDGTGVGAAMRTPLPTRGVPQISPHTP